MQGPTTRLKFKRTEERLSKRLLIRNIKTQASWRFTNGTALYSDPSSHRHYLGFHSSCPANASAPERWLAGCQGMDCKRLPSSSNHPWKPPMYRKRILMMVIQPHIVYRDLPRRLGGISVTLNFKHSLGFSPQAQKLCMPRLKQRFFLVAFS